MPRKIEVTQRSIDDGIKMFREYGSIRSTLYWSALIALKSESHHLTINTHDILDANSFDFDFYVYNLKTGYNIGKLVLGQIPTEKVIPFAMLAHGLPGRIYAKKN